MSHTAGGRLPCDDHERTTGHNAANQSDYVDVIKSTQNVDLVEKVVFVFDCHPLTGVSRQYSHQHLTTVELVRRHHHHHHQQQQQQQQRAD